MRFALDELRVVGSFEEVASALVPPVEALRVPAVERAHTSRNVRVRRLDQEMEVVSHQAIGEALPVEPHNRATEPVEEGQAIECIGEDWGAAIAACRHVIEAAGYLKPWLSSHRVDLTSGNGRRQVDGTGSTHCRHICARD